LPRLKKPRHKSPARLKTEQEDIILILLYIAVPVLASLFGAFLKKKCGRGRIRREKWRKTVPGTCFSAAMRAGWLEMDRHRKCAAKALGTCLSLVFIEGKA